MGTRALVIVMDDQIEVMTMYRQMDGYPSGLGQALKQTFGNHKIVNGIGYDQTMATHANGMSCLAAQIVASQKLDIGGIYLLKPGSREHGEEYIYILHAAPVSKGGKVYFEERPLLVTVFDGNKCNYEIYSGPLADMPTEYSDEEGNER